MFAAWTISYLIALWSAHLLAAFFRTLFDSVQVHFQSSLAVRVKYLKDTFLPLGIYCSVRHIRRLDFLNLVWIILS